MSTADAHAILRSMEIMYGSSMSDHIPFVCSLDVDSLPEMSCEVNTDCNSKIDWSKVLNYLIKMLCYTMVGLIYC